MVALLALRPLHRPHQQQTSGSRVPHTRCPRATSGFRCNAALNELFGLLELIPQALACLPSLRETWIAKQRYGCKACCEERAGFLGFPLGVLPTGCRFFSPVATLKYRSCIVIWSTRSGSIISSFFFEFVFLYEDCPPDRSSGLSLTGKFWLRIETSLTPDRCLSTSELIYWMS